MEDYNLPNAKVIMGDLENAIALNTIIRFTKKRIYNAIKKEQKPHILGVKTMLKTFISMRNIAIT